LYLSSDITGIKVERKEGDSLSHV